MVNITMASIKIVLLYIQELWLSLEATLVKELVLCSWVTFCATELKMISSIAHIL